MNAFLILILASFQSTDPTPPPSVPDAEQGPSVGDTQGSGIAREEMWRAPTAEDWQKPVLITFQRSWEDAFAVSRETGKPILACINMDGEIASEHYAGVRYRESDVAALYEPYVCVVASVYRHNARDFDSDGNRILCPRFGSVTCGEHIALEPTLYSLYLDEERVAPRHVVIELDGSESQDIYYANDTASVFNVIYQSAQGRPAPREINRGDRPLPDRIASADIADRTAVEQAFSTGDLATQRQILEAALVANGSEQNQLWRMALHSGSPELARLAVKGLAQATSPGAIDLILSSMRGLEQSSDREVLVGTLERIGKDSERARQLVRTFRGLDAKSGAVDGEATAVVLADSGGVRRDVAVERLEGYAKALPTGSGTYAVEGAALTPEQLAMQALLRAEAQLDLVRSDETDPRYLALHMEDASRNLTAARPIMETELAWRWELVDIAFDLARGGGAVWIQSTEDRAATLIPTLSEEARAQGGLALRDVLSAFVHQRQRKIRDAVRTKSEWPPAWMADAAEAFRAIQDAPATTAADFIDRRDFLAYMGAFAEADAMLEGALDRFPLDALVHERLRARLLWDKKLDAIDGLEGRYEALLAAPDASPTLEWYAGYASRTAAEVRRRSGQPVEAAHAYRRAIEHFAKAAEGQPVIEPSCHFQTAVCIAGEARLALDANQPSIALQLILTSFETAPEAASALDGLNMTAIMTANAIQGAGSEAEAATLTTKLDELRQLDPHLFDPPEFERTSQGRRPVGFGGKRFTGPR